MKDGIVVLSLCALAVAAAAGCKLQVDKSSNGESEDVKIATPFGGISVNKNQTSPAELGLPVYPGSVLDTEADGTKSARVDMGFGSWRLRVRAADYKTPDGRDQVLAFYRSALSEYGSVIECAGDKPVGAPTRTVEGLTCADSDHSQPDHEHVSTHTDPRSFDLELKAGSPRHQHLVVLKGESNSATRYSLIALDLPHGPPNERQGTN